MFDIVKSWFDMIFPRNFVDPNPEHIQDETYELSIYDLADEVGVQPFVSPTYTYDELKNNKE